MDILTLARTEIAKLDVEIPLLEQRRERLRALIKTAEQLYPGTSVEAGGERAVPEGNSKGALKMVPAPWELKIPKVEIPAYLHNINKEFAATLASIHASASFKGTEEIIAGIVTTLKAINPSSLEASFPGIATSHNESMTSKIRRFCFGALSKGSALPTAQLLSRLTQAGIEVTGSAPRTTLSIILSRAPEFISDKELGGWRLLRSGEAPSAEELPDANERTTYQPTNASSPSSHNTFIGLLSPELPTGLLGASSVSPSIPTEHQGLLTPLKK